MAKKIIDISIGVFALITLAPLLIIIGIAVRLFLGSPIFFTQQRPGLNGKLFKMYKFRSMTNKIDKNGVLLADNKRMTKLGCWLRSTSLDELPELLNVVRGEMSIVGPRPLLDEYLPLYNERQSKRHNVRPGITGWAQINGRNNISWDTRLEMDVWYVENQTTLLDIKILLQTVVKVASRQDISQAGHVTCEPFKGNNQES